MRPGQAGWHAKRAAAIGVAAVGAAVATDGLRRRGAGRREREG
jgi:hypothetical protein